MKVHKKAHVDALRRRQNGSSSGTGGTSEYNISFPYWLGEEIDATSSNSSSSTGSGTIGGGSVTTNNTNGSTTKDQFSPAMSTLRAAQKVFKSTPRPLKTDECGWTLRNKKLLKFRKQIAILEKRESVPAPKTDLAKKQLQHPSPREQRNFYEKGGIGEQWIPNKMRASFLREQQNALNNGGLGNTNGRVKQDANREKVVVNGHKGAFYLKVNFLEKDLAKQAGANWDQSNRLWYVPADLVTNDMSKFSAWISNSIIQEVDAGVEGGAEGGVEGEIGRAHV
jgi:hypothetical protein